MTCQPCAPHFTCIPETLGGLPAAAAAALYRKRGSERWGDVSTVPQPGVGVLGLRPTLSSVRSLGPWESRANSGGASSCPPSQCPLGGAPWRSSHHPASTRLSTKQGQSWCSDSSSSEMRWKNTGELAWEGRVLRSRRWLSGAAAQTAETRFHSFEHVRTYCMPGTERGQRVGGSAARELTLHHTSPPKHHLHRPLTVSRHSHHLEATGAVITPKERVWKMKPREGQ